MQFQKELQCSASIHVSSGILILCCFWKTCQQGYQINHGRVHVHITYMYVGETGLTRNHQNFLLKIFPVLNFDLEIKVRTRGHLWPALRSLHSLCTVCSFWQPSASYLDVVHVDLRYPGYLTTLYKITVRRECLCKIYLHVV